MINDECSTAEHRSMLANRNATSRRKVTFSAPDTRGRTKLLLPPDRVQQSSDSSPCQLHLLLTAALAFRRCNGILADTDANTLHGAEFKGSRFLMLQFANK
jgi:hypothetical protein